MHKFLCCSDTHGQLPPAVKDQSITAVLHAGDFFGMGKKQAQACRLQEWAAACPVPVLRVKGNHDCAPWGQLLEGCGHDISGQVVRIAPGLHVAGIGWAGEQYFDLPTEEDLKAVCDKALASARSTMKPGDRCVLLTHYPANLSEVFPSDGSDKTGVFWHCLRELIHALRPLAVIQGHVHGLFLSQGQYTFNGGCTLVAYPGPEGGILAYDPKATHFQAWL